jgi:hypothetical protein
MEHGTNDLFAGDLMLIFATRFIMDQLVVHALSHLTPWAHLGLKVVSWDRSRVRVESIDDRSTVHVGVVVAVLADSGGFSFLVIINHRSNNPD